VAVFPVSLQDVAVSEDYLSRAVEFAIAEVASVNSAIFLAPLESALSVDDVVFEVASQSSDVRLKGSIALFLAIEKFS
jgi:hypothetical protein